MSLVPNTPEYEQAMIDKADQGLHQESLESVGGVEDNANEVSKTDGDAKIRLLAGKYKTQEDLEKGILELVKKEAGEDLEAYYKRLEGNLGKPKEDVSNKLKEGTEEKPKENDNANASKSFEGTLFEGLNEEFSSEGALKDETIDKLTKAGIPKSMIETHLAGLKAMQELSAIKADSEAVKLYTVVGGEENFNNIKQWAFDTLPEQDIQEFNSVIETGNLAAIKLALRGMKSLYDEANGVKPTKLLTGSPSTSSAGDTYTSYKEVTKDMNSIEYKKNPAFRKMVAEKLSRSKV